MSKKFSPYQQAMRHNRMKYFEKCVLPFIYEYDVSAPNEHCFKVVDTPKGDLTIYPKGDKIQLQNGSWISKDIVQWLQQVKIINEKIPSFKNWLHDLKN